MLQNTIIKITRKKTFNKLQINIKYILNANNKIFKRLNY